VKKILVFGAHPDDIELGVGGTVAKYIEEGASVLMVVVTTPSEQRIEECKKAANILKADLKMLNIPQSELVKIRELVIEFDKIINDFNPDEIYTHWIHDSHQEHKFVTQGVIAASRKNLCSVYMYDQTIPSGITEGNFNAQLFVDISKYIDIKLKAIEINESQFMPNRGMEWIDAVKGRCAYRGYQIAVKYAEVFEIVKEIRK